MRKSFLIGLVTVGLILLAAQDPYIPGPAWVFVLAMAAGVVVTLISLVLGALALLA